MTTKAADAMLIETQDLIKIYKTADIEVIALRGLDLRVRTSEIVAIIGSSGSGKSTLLNVLSGLDFPSAGNARGGDRELMKMSSGDMVSFRRHEIGFVWQQADRNLVPYLTAQQNVEMPLLLDGWSSLASAGSAQPSCWRRWGWSTVPATARARCPAARSSGSPSPSPTRFSPSSMSSGSAHTTIVSVSHDPAIADKVDRVVAIRDGKTSTETVRLAPGLDGAGGHQEFAVVDAAGRLQIPRELLDRLQITHRAQITLEDNHIAVWPEAGRPETRPETHDGD